MRRGVKACTGWRRHQGSHAPHSPDAGVSRNPGQRDCAAGGPGACRRRPSPCPSPAGRGDLLSGAAATRPAGPAPFSRGRGIGVRGAAAPRSHLLPVPPSGPQPGRRRLPESRAASPCRCRIRRPMALLLPATSCFAALRSSRTPRDSRRTGLNAPRHPGVPRTRNGSFRPRGRRRPGARSRGGCPCVRRSGGRGGWARGTVLPRRRRARACRGNRRRGTCG